MGELIRLGDRKKGKEPVGDGHQFQVVVSCTLQGTHLEYEVDVEGDFPFPKDRLAGLLQKVGMDLLECQQEEGANSPERFTSKELNYIQDHCGYEPFKEPEE
jgi:hypothetical protein